MSPVQTYYDLKNDVAFKRTFGSEGTEEITLDLLNSLLTPHLEAPLVSLEFINKEQHATSEKGKSGRLDVLCKDAKGNRYIIEMQAGDHPHFGQRVQFYTAVDVANQLNKGKTYGDLRRVITLSFLNFSLFPDFKNYTTNFGALELTELKPSPHVDLLNYTFVDLPKFRESIKHVPLEKLDHKQRLCKVIADAGTLNKAQAKKLTQDDPIMQMILRNLEAERWNEKDRARYLQAAKWDMDYDNGMISAERRGEQRGERRGEQRGKRIGEQRGRQKALNDLVTKGIITLEQARSL